MFKSDYKKVIGTFWDIGKACHWASLGEICLGLGEALMLVRSSWVLGFPTEDSSLWLKRSKLTAFWEPNGRILLVQVPTSSMLAFT